MAIDFSTADGAALVRRMAASADVLVENFKVGGLAKFGLDAASLRAANPRLIYASITGFGQDGPYAQRAGYDYIIQAMGGLMSVTGLPDGEPGGGPVRAGVAVADLFTGMYTANAILAALVRRGVTGEGATIDLASPSSQRSPASCASERAAAVSRSSPSPSASTAESRCRRTNAGWSRGSLASAAAPDSPHRMAPRIRCESYFACAEIDKWAKVVKASGAKAD